MTLLGRVMDQDNTASLPGIAVANTLQSNSISSPSSSEGHLQPTSNFLQSLPPVPQVPNLSLVPSSSNFWPSTTANPFLASTTS